MASSPGRERLLTLAELERRLQHSPPGSIMLAEDQTAALLGRTTAELNADLELLVAAGKVHEGRLFFDAAEVLKRGVDRKERVARIERGRGGADALLEELRGQGFDWPGAE